MTRKNKSMSPLIATVLLIAVTVALATVISSWIASQKLSRIPTTSTVTTLNQGCLNNYYDCRNEAFRIYEDCTTKVYYPSPERIADNHYCGIGNECIWECSFSLNLPWEKRGNDKTE